MARWLLPCGLATIIAVGSCAAPASAGLGEPVRLSEHFEIVPDSPALLLTTFHHVWRTTPGTPRRHVAVAYSIRKPIVSGDGRRCLVYGEVDEDALPGRPGPRERRGIWLLDANGSITRLHDGARINHALTSFLPASRAPGILLYAPRPEADPRGWIRAATTEGVDTIHVLLDASEAHRVALLGAAGEAEALHAAGASLDRPNHSGLTPLELAIVAGNEPVAATLCSLGVESGRGFPRALAMAVVLGRLDALRALARFGVDVRGRDTLGAGPLHWAVENPDGLRARLPRDPREPLLGFFGAARAPLAPERFHACLATLLELGADVRAADARRQTPLHRLAGDDYVRPGWKRRDYARAGERVAATAEMLLAAGADPEARDENGRTPLRTAVERQRFDLAEPLLRTLLARGVSVEAPVNGVTTLEGIFERRSREQEEITGDELRAAAFLAAHGARLERLLPDERRRLERRLRRGMPGAWAR